MAGLSRRGFLAASAGMAVALGVPERALAARLAEPATPLTSPPLLNRRSAHRAEVPGSTAT